MGLLRNTYSTRPKPGVLLKQTAYLDQLNDNLLLKKDYACYESSSHICQYWYDWDRYYIEIPLPMQENATQKHTVLAQM
jgi:hypothetical protein